jgi:hypothetical protein
MTSIGKEMHKFIEEKNWEGTADALASHAKLWMRIKRIGDPTFVPNERLVRDYVAKGILSKPERKGKEAIFGFEQLVQFLACRAMIEDGWPLSKISEDFQVSSIWEILKLIPGEAAPNDAMTLIESFKSEMLVEDLDLNMNEKLSFSANTRPSKDTDASDFLKRRRESYETKSDIKDVLYRLGSDFGNVIREDFTAYQLASWLVLLIDRDKARGITRHEAEDIGRGITAALLNRNSLSKADWSSYTKQMKELSLLDDEIRTREYDLKRIQAERHKLNMDIEHSKKTLAELEERLRKAGK